MGYFLTTSWIQQSWLKTPLDTTDALLSSSSCTGQKCEAKIHKNSNDGLVKKLSLTFSWGSITSGRRTFTKHWGTRFILTYRDKHQWQRDFSSQENSYPKRNQDPFVYWNTEYMMWMRMLDIHRRELVVPLENSSQLLSNGKSSPSIPRVFSWQTHSLVETDEINVSNDPDNGFSLVSNGEFTGLTIDSDIKSNEDGQDWDLTNDDFGSVVWMIEDEFARTSHEWHRQEHQLLVRRRTGISMIFKYWSLVAISFSFSSITIGLS